MTVVTFVDYVPPPRYDGRAWTSVRISESTSSVGPWTPIDSFVLSPFDTDPQNPSSRNFTTDNATLAAGWYQIVFLDDDLDEQPTVPVQLLAQDAILPSVDDVAALLHTRTTVAGTGGREAGTFTEQTRPTNWQVANLIEQAYFFITATLPTEGAPLRLQSAARHLTAVYAAVLVEQSYFPEQIAAGQSSVDALQSMLATGVSALAVATNDDQPNALRWASVPVTTITSGNVPFVESELLP